MTRHGRPCRNPAARGTEPPACARHRGRPVPSLLPMTLPLPLPIPPRRPAPARPHFYFPTAAAAEDAHEANELGADLQPEIDLVRLVLRRLAVYLDEYTAELPSEEVRRLTGLVFSGARTVAYLLGQRTAQPDELRHWLDGALDAFAADRGIDL